MIYGTQAKVRWFQTLIPEAPPVMFLLLKMREKPIRKLGDLFSKISHPKGNPQNKGV